MTESTQVALAEAASHTHCSYKPLNEALALLDHEPVPTSPARRACRTTMTSTSLSVPKRRRDARDSNFKAR